MELCSIVNFSLRSDLPALLIPAVQIITNINQLCVVRRKGVAMFPAQGMCFRGSGLPEQHQGFFVPGKKYRVPGFLASSSSEAIAFGFLIRAHIRQSVPVVLWRIHFDERGLKDPRYRCRHVNLVRHCNVANEEEFLFAPYSTFTVRAVAWNVGDDMEPHIIDLEAAIDNKREDEGVPLAPYY